MAINLNPPSGTRDFSAEVLAKRNYLKSIISQQFEKFCYNPLETPAMEHSSILNGKYGQDGDKLIFHILNSGDPFKNIDPNSIPLDYATSKIKNKIAEKALRYDLTVPLARYVCNNINQLVFPFKRYQIQPVWRGDRPQKGRYREFLQCDADILAPKLNYIQEAELICIYIEVFAKLKLPVIIKLNDRRLLKVLHQLVFTSPNNSLENHFIDFCNLLDKKDKIKIEIFIQELEQLGITANQRSVLLNLLQLAEPATNLSKINEDLPFFEIKQNFDQLLGGHLKYLQTYLNNNTNFFSDYIKINTDLSLARGLNYYTGLIVEVIPDICKIKEIYNLEIKMGSLGGGGRYSNFTKMFQVNENIDGMGISFGLDRIYDVLEELNLFAQLKTQTPKILFLNSDTELWLNVLPLLQILRNNNIAIEYFQPSNIDYKKQIKYALAKNIHFGIFYNQEQANNNQLNIKNFIRQDLSQLRLNLNATNWINELKNYLLK